ncbi:MAG: hypothetical protein MZW92_38775 [Comamonadaceae bacterium]|nr:hypothetical protein [Comamonadaceae bacterium]
MLLVTFAVNNQHRIGALDRARGEVIDFSVAAPDLPGRHARVRSRGGEAVPGRGAARSGEAAPGACRWRRSGCWRRSRARRAISCASARTTATMRSEVQSIASCGRRRACRHAPIIFTKATTAVIGPGAPIPAIAAIRPARSTTKASWRW